jgi:hypothetical protein
MPALRFAVDGAEAVRFAAAPTLAFALRVENATGEPVRSLSLDVQLRIAGTRRRYDGPARARLAETFGPPERWDTTLGTLFWTRATLVVPAFTGATRVEMPIACTYDFEVASTAYLDALGDGDVPVAFLFSGTVFYGGEGGRLRVERIPWDSEAELRLPVATWREAIDRYFPNSAWLRLSRDTFGRLRAYKARRALPTWEAAVEELLGDDGRRP